MPDTQKNLYKKLLGAKGERLAIKALKKQKYKILGKNLKNKYAEIDVLAIKKDVLCFCEVKTRTNDNFGTPAMAVDKSKQKKYREFAQIYLSENSLDCDVDFIVVEVTPQGVNVIEHAF
ncbi:MAG TPA: hypothetical protein DDY82_00450 [Clostridiales bacterium]|nr:hypothetical protein [Clostridiales bacterium]HBJ97535.1 hypothetical protein [Clostridiales bacterium]